MENAPEVSRFRRLTERQAQVAGHAALGLSNAEVGYALGIAEGGQLLLWASDLAQKFQLGLTSAEQQVASDLALGLTNQQIATRRGRAVLTIANHVASILTKDGCGVALGVADQASELASLTNRPSAATIPKPTDRLGLLGRH